MPPESFEFFIDRSLGRKQFPKVLRDAGLVTHVHDDHFEPDAPDIEWLTFVGKKGWVVLTQDKRIRYRTLEREALLRAGVAAFVLTGGDLQAREIGEAFLKALPNMKKILTSHTRPFIATVSRSGVVAVRYGGGKPE